MGAQTLPRTRTKGTPCTFDFAYCCSPSAPANDPLLFAPGTDFSYSTYAFTLLSAVMAESAGCTFSSPRAV